MQIERSFPVLQRRAVILTLVLVTCVITPDSVNSGIAKLPLFTLGSLLVAALLLSGWISRGMLDFTSTRTHILVLLHIPLILISGLTSYDGTFTANALWFGLSCVISYFAGSFVFREKSDVESFLSALEILALALCLVAAFQVFFGRVLPLEFSIGPERRPPSLLGNSGFFGSYIVAVFPLILTRAIGSEPGSLFRKARVVLLGILTLLLFATRTRSSVIGWIAAACVFMILVTKSRRTRYAVIIAGTTAGCLIVYATLINPGVAERAFGLLGAHREVTLPRRMFFWKAGLDALGASPLTGHGTGSYERMVFQYRSPRYWENGGEDIVPHAHNEVLEIAVEYGIAGLLLSGATLIAVVCAGVRSARTQEAPGRLIAAGLTAAIAGVAVDNLAGVSLRQPPVAMIIWLFMGMLTSRALSPGRSNRIQFPVPLPAAAIAVPIALFAVFSLVFAPGEARALRSDAHQLRGVMLEGGDPAAARQEYGAAIRENPYNLQARSGLTLAYLNAGLWTDAVQSAEGLRRLSPLYPKINLMDAYALFRLGQLPEALEEITRELRERSHPESFRLQAMIFRGLRDVRGERDALAGLLRNDIRGKNAYACRESAGRLLELSSDGYQQREARDIVDSLTAVFIQEREFLRMPPPTAP